MGAYRDALLIAQNAMMYNMVGSDVYHAGQEFKEYVMELFGPLIVRAKMDAEAAAAAAAEATTTASSTGDAMEE